ncbi:MAG: solute carrier family 26 protein [Balneolaceae bacterium]|nr:solute carrier family 26 protein [Balneolaceae bacterium]
MNHNNKSLLDRYVPMTDWLRDYSRFDFRNDTRAGLTVGVLLIPQSMAYALLAGLPPVYGLYASIVPLAVYAMLGTSRQLSIGPVAILSILMASGLSSLAEPATGEYIQLVLAVAFLVGATQFIMGLFRLGFLMNFLSKPVLSGFTSAAACIIGFSQLGNLLGIELARSKYIFVVARDAIRNVDLVHLPTLIISLGCILMILFIKRWKPRWPSQLIAVIVAVIVTWLLRLDQLGVDIVGSVERGYPTPILPQIGSLPYWKIAPTVLAISFLGFAQSIALAKAMVRRNPDYTVDSNQELFSIGLANMVGSFFHAYPVAGSFSRTAVNDENRAKTGISLLVSAGMVTLTVLFLTPLIHYLPYAVLGAIIVTAVPGLVEIGEARFLWQVRKRDFTLMLVTFVSTLALGILEGIGVGVLISLGIVIHRSSYPNIVMLGRLPNTDQYRDLERHPEGLTQTNTIIVRIDASLYFANIPYMKEKLQQLEAESGKNLQQVIIDAIGINDVDSSALHALKEIVDEYKSRDIDVMFTGVKGPVRDIFRRSGLADVVGPDQFYLDITHAVDSLEHEGEEESHLVDENDTIENTDTSPI